jgi:CRP-like cAMP-binding protein
MSASTDALKDIPLFRNITTSHMEELEVAFEKCHFDSGDVLFTAGAEPQHLFVLMDGEIVLKEGDEVRFSLSAPAPIGELGAVSGLSRNTTAIATSKVEVWRISRADLMGFFEDHGDVAFPFYHNLMQVVSDKIRQESRRIDEMRTNLIRTQKAMKRMRDLILESTETEISAPMHDTLEDLIGRNRRSNYVVEPPRTLPALVRLGSGVEMPVRELSAVWLVVTRSPLMEVETGDHWTGVLLASGMEIPVSGNVSDVREDSIIVELDLLLEEYAVQLEDYLTRVQMLTVVV